MEDARSYLLDKLNTLGEYAFLPEGLLAEMVDQLIELDAAFMAQTGVEEGEPYDDDEALAALCKGMQKAYPDYAMYMMRLSEDYLDYNEEYLDSIGAIDWT